MHFRNTLLKENTLVFQKIECIVAAVLGRRLGPLGHARIRPRTDRPRPAFRGRNGRDPGATPEFESHLLHLLSRQASVSPSSPAGRGTVLNIWRGVEERLKYRRGSALSTREHHVTVSSSGDLCVSTTRCHSAQTPQHDLALPRTRPLAPHPTLTAFPLRDENLCRDSHTALKDPRSREERQG